jgi:hypothetical protein
MAIILAGDLAGPCPDNEHEAAMGEQDKCNEPVEKEPMHEIRRDHDPDARCTDEESELKEVATGCQPHGRLPRPVPVNARRCSVADPDERCGLS